MSKYKSYCTALDFLEQIQSVYNALIVVICSLSNVKMGHWLCIFQTAKIIEFIDPLGLPCALWTPQINYFIENSGKSIIQNQKRVQDLTNKSYRFHALLYFIF